MTSSSSSSREVQNREENRERVCPAELRLIRTPLANYNKLLLNNHLTDGRIIYLLFNLFVSWFRGINSIRIGRTGLFVGTGSVSGFKGSGGRP